MTDAIGTTERAYDALGRLLSSIDPYGQTVQMAYDAAGNRIALTYPGSSVVAYDYDAKNQLVAVTDWENRTTTYDYDEAGNLLAANYPNGTHANYTYDPAERLVSLDNRDPANEIICSYAHTLDPVGNRIQVEADEPLIPFIKTQSIAYQYNADNQLTSMTGGSLSYDANGNLTAKTEGQ